MDERKLRSATWDVLLWMAITGQLACLLSQLLEPAFEAWRKRPRPGVQVCQQYVGKEDKAANAITTQLDYLLYLPPGYAASRKWPLVIYLHGSGHRGRDVNISAASGATQTDRLGQAL